jgi:hypothetical protein
MIGNVNDIYIYMTNGDEREGGRVGRIESEIG